MLRERATAGVGWLIRAVWFGVIPALLAGLTFRYLLPSANGNSAGLVSELGQFAARNSAPLGAALFVYFAVLVRYWGAHLPGAPLWLNGVEDSAPSKRQLFWWCVSMGLAVSGALLLRAVFFQSYRVLSASMLPTLRPAALIVAKPSAYGLRVFGAQPEPPHRGDVVVFRTPASGVREPLVKRVIGLPGDRISTNIGHPVINGWVVPSCNAGRFVYLSQQGLLNGMMEVEFLGDATYLTVYSSPLRVDLAGYVVPPGEVFLFGDNRNNSSDSRAWNGGQGGSLPFSEILGRVDRLLVDAKRNGDLDLASFLRPLSAPLVVEGMDISSLQAGIARCKSKRPERTLPPAPGATP